MSPLWTALRAIMKMLCWSSIKAMYAEELDKARAAKSPKR